jgi:hypothetical protein
MSKSIFDKIDIIQKIVELMIEVEFSVMLLLKRVEKLLFVLIFQNTNILGNVKRKKRILRIEDEFLCI